MVKNIEKAGELSFMNMHALLKDKKCGCYYCGRIFSTDEINEWTDVTLDEDGEVIDGTAICPYCGIDSVIGESDGLPMTEEAMKELYTYYFE